MSHKLRELALGVRHQVFETRATFRGGIPQEQHARESDCIFDVLRDVVLKCEDVVEKSLTESGEYLPGEVSGVMDVVTVALRKHFELAVQEVRDER